MITQTYSGQIRSERLRVNDLSVENYFAPRRQYKHPLVFIHGMWCTGETFGDLMRSLCALGYDCYAPTLRGHADSKPVQDLGKVGIDEYADDVEEFLHSAYFYGRFEPSSKVILIGHSMGEIVATQVATRIPYLVAGHISMTSAPPRGVLLGWEAIKRMPKYLKGIFGCKPVMLTPEDAKWLLFNGLAPETQQELIRKMVPESGRAALQITAGKYSMKRLHCPSLVIRGSYDRITPRQGAVARRLGAESQTMPCGHMLMCYPHNQEVSMLIDGWIKMRIPDGIIRE